MEDVYFKKYLKYKAKYQQLKQIGGVTLLHGDHMYFVPTAVANELCPSGVGKSSPSNNAINNLLEKAGIVYRGKLGDRKLTLVETNTTKAKRIAYEKAVATGKMAVKGVKATGSAIASGAKMAGEAALMGTVLAGKALTSGARATGSAIASGARATRTSLGKGLASLGERLQSGGGLTKKINELVEGDIPVEIILDQPLSYANAREVMEKLKVVNSAIASMVTIDIKRIGSNICQRVE